MKKKEAESIAKKIIETQSIFKKGFCPEFSEAIKKKYVEDLLILKPEINDFVNDNQGENQEIYLHHLTGREQEFCDDVECFFDSIEELEDMIADDKQDFLDFFWTYTDDIRQNADIVQHSFKLIK